MTADQKVLLMSVIEARIGVPNADDAAGIMARIEAWIDQPPLAGRALHAAWGGSFPGEGAHGYHRIRPADHGRRPD